MVVLHRETSTLIVTDFIENILIELSGKRVFEQVTQRLCERVRRRGSIRRALYRFMAAIQ
jgi:hypothetical protein